MGLAEFLLGKENPFTQWVGDNQNYLGAVAAGLGSGQNIQAGLGSALQMMPEATQLDLHAREKRKADALAEQQANATTNWLAEKYPQYAKLPPSEGFKLALEAEQAKYQGLGAGGGMPANVREWEYFNKLAPEDQSAYLRMKRANPYLDIGTGFVQPDPINPGGVAGPAIVKENFQEAADTAQGAAVGRETGERQMQAPVAQAGLQQANAKTDNVIATIDSALGMTGSGETGLIGSVMGGVPGTKAYDLRAAITTVKANLGFAELQAMRDASPTGGALGQVAVQELEALQSAVANLDANQSEDQIRTNLGLVKQLLERQKQYRQMAVEAKFGAPAPTGGGDDIEAILSGMGL